MELATSDQSAGKNFYTSLFGWAPNDIPMGPDSYYTIFRMNGRDVAAGCTLQPDEVAMHIPPHWNLYISVDNADASAKKAGELGGKVIAGPFDVADAGRMAVIQDPTGAYFCLWQPQRNTGVGIVGDPGAFCWADLNTPDPDRAGKFYSALFGWKFSLGEKDPNGYLHIQNGDKFIGGVPPVQFQNPSAPPHWLLYFSVADVDVSTAKAKDLGARFFMPPMTIEGVGRMAIMADPQGAVSAIFTRAEHR